MASLAALFTASTAGEKYQSKGTCNIVCIVYFTMETNSSGPLLVVPYCLPFLVRQSYELASICEAYIILFCTCKFCRHYKQVHSLQLLLLNCARVGVYSWTAPSGEIWQAVTPLTGVYITVAHVSSLFNNLTSSFSLLCGSGMAHCSDALSALHSSVVFFVKSIC